MRRNQQPAPPVTWSSQMSDGHGATRGSRWEGRPLQASAVQAIAFLVPVMASFAVAIVVNRLLPDPTSAGERAGGWVLVLVTSSAMLWTAERLAQRLLPLATLLRMSMLFPDKAPSRYRVARQVNSTRTLQERIEKARAAGRTDEPAQAAAAILELVAALHVHDRHTRGHAERVRVYADLIADEMGLRREQADRLRWASLLHDIGKLAVPAQILNKPGKPTDDEWERLRAHPEAGLRFLGPLRNWLGEWAQAVPQHHEQWDGSGYPHGLAGAEIHLGARIVAVADSYEVMTAGRPYKKAMSPAAAREELLRCAGSQFDPAVVRALLQISVGRLRWAMGPLSWIATLPFLPQIAHASPLTHVANAVSSGATNVAMAGALTATAVAQPAPLMEVVDRLAELAPVTIQAVLADEGSLVTPGGALPLAEDGRPGPPECAGQDGADKPGCGDENRARPEQPRGNSGITGGDGLPPGQGREHAPGQAGRDGEGPPGQAGREGEGPPGQAGRDGEGPPGQADDAAEPPGQGQGRAADAPPDEGAAAVEAPEAPEDAGAPPNAGPGSAGGGHGSGGGRGSPRDSAPAAPVGG